MPVDFEHGRMGGPQVRAERGDLQTDAAIKPVARAKRSKCSDLDCERPEPDPHIRVRWQQLHVGPAFFSFSSAHVFAA